MGGLSSGVTGRIMTETMMKPTGAEVRLIPVLSVAPDKVPHFADCMAESDALENWLKEHQGTATDEDFQAYMTVKNAEGKNPVGMMTQLVRAVFVSPAAVAADEVAAVRDALGLCREIVSRWMKKLDPLNDAESLAGWKETRVMLSHLQALAFPDSPDGTGARSVWLRDKSDVQGLPAVARCYLYPNDFTGIDRKGIEGHCRGVLSLTETMWQALERGRKPETVGFSTEEISTALILCNALRCSLSYPCEELAAKGYRYRTGDYAAEKVTQ